MNQHCRWLSGNIFVFSKLLYFGNLKGSQSEGPIPPPSISCYLKTPVHIGLRQPTLTHPNKLKLGTLHNLKPLTKIPE